VTLHGKQTIRRRYYHCGSCGYGECPEDTALDLIPGKLSTSVADKACLAAAMAPFDRATDLLYRLSGIQIGPDCLEAAAIRKGSEVYREDMAAAEELLDEIPLSGHISERVYFLADGSMLNTRTDGWKENKLAMAFSEENIKKSGVEQKQRIRILKKQFATAFAEGVDTFRKLVRLLAVRTGAFHAKEVVVVSDGAPWI
jgi:hypothetical protein